MTSIAELRTQSSQLTARIAEVEKTQRKINDLYLKIDRAKKSTLIYVWTAPIAKRDCLLDNYPIEEGLGYRLRDTVLAILHNQLKQAQAHLETLLE